MSNSNKSRHLSRLTTAHSIRKFLLLPAAGAMLTLSSCKDDTPASPLHSITDTAPVGEGLKILGYAVLGSAVVTTLGKIAR